MSTAKKSRKKAPPSKPTGRKARRTRAEDTTCAPDEGAGVIDWLAGPSDQAKARVAEIRERWQRLQDWGVRQKLPNTREQQASVENFLSSWPSSPDVSNIGAITSDLVVIERYAAEYDKRRGGAFRAAPISTTYDPDASSRLRAGAALADTAAREVTAVAKEAASDAQEAVRPILQEANSSALPVLFGIGVGFALGVVVIVLKSQSRVVSYV
jgi:hypothetical protein